MSADFRIEHNIGRLIEARVFALQSASDANVYGQGLVAEVRKRPAGMLPILLADHRPVFVYPQPVADRLVELFQDMNSRLDRVAIIVAPTNATLLLQLDRIVREAHFEKRKVFRSEDGAIEFLASALDPMELSRAKVFLGEHR